MNLRLILVVAVALSLSACGGNDRQDAGEAAEQSAMPVASGEDAVGSDETDVAGKSAGDAVSPRPASFTQCAACHSVKPDGKGVGPTLAGVYGAKAGHIGDYAYSSAMRQSGLVWDEASLNAYLQNPASTVPGTKMSYRGLQDAQKRAEIIEYLKTL